MLMNVVDCESDSEVPSGIIVNNDNKKIKINQIVSTCSRIVPLPPPSRTATEVVGPAFGDITIAPAADSNWLIASRELVRRDALIFDARVEDGEGSISDERSLFLCNARPFSLKKSSKC